VPEIKKLNLTVLSTIYPVEIALTISFPLNLAKIAIDGLRLVFAVLNYAPDIYQFGVSLLRLDKAKSLGHNN
jgi:membrane-anchored protein YejM (alkaline phosphatase superfamily)